jgi:hypothetical protein
MPSTDCQNGGITFGRWKLFPVDANNWELCHWHVATRGKNKGVEQWNRLGRYYSYNTFGNALLYAVDCEMKDECAEAVMELDAALDRYERIAEGLRDAMLGAVNA